MSIYKLDAPFKLEPVWYNVMKILLLSGLVLRKVETIDGRGVWKVGVVIKHDDGWQWVEMTPAMQATCPYEIPLVRASLIGVFSDSGTDDVIDGVLGAA